MTSKNACGIVKSINWLSGSLTERCGEKKNQQLNLSLNFRRTYEIQD